MKQFCRDIYNYFGNSDKRIKELKECKVFCAEKPHSMLRPAQTRWLPLGTAVGRILDDWNSLTLFFTSAALQKRIPSAQSILNALKIPIYKMYCLFLGYISEIINDLNMEFQSEKP